ncbi:hypothetical protein [Halorarum salinum]|uniref:Uncharacterized protein n=1 Tax=Halorarum salinum TaxID=2743089 RepID=A0A7D5Q9P8_9EURY|nr:hypothetical protein [Halobaculum salinum]QLG61836.1 hypothetical protein HUG12_08900 [Halobaculum salinum]
MVSDRTIDESAVSFRLHGTVVDRNGSSPGDGTACDVVVVDCPDGTRLSLLDPDGRVAEGVVGATRTLAVAIDGVPAVRPAADGPTVEPLGEGVARLAGRRTAACTWDGEAVSVPIDLGFDVASVPVRGTTRPRREAGATDEILAGLGIDDCSHVAADGARLVVHAVDDDPDTDPWAGVVYDEVAVELDLDDERFRESLGSGGGPVELSMRMTVGPRWFLGDETRYGTDTAPWHLAGLLDAVTRLLDGEPVEYACLYGPLRFELRPRGDGVARVRVAGGGGGHRPRFPPDGVLVRSEALVEGFLHGARDLLPVVSLLAGRDDDGFVRLRDAISTARTRLAGDEP